MSKTILTSEQKETIKLRYQSGETNKTALGRAFGVSARTIGRVLATPEEQWIPQVGDIITGKIYPEPAYRITTSEAVMKVIGVFGSGITVKLIASKDFPKVVGDTFYVNSEHFIKIGASVEEEVVEEEVVEEVEEEVEEEVVEEGVEAPCREELMKNFEVGQKYIITEDTAEYLNRWTDCYVAKGDVVEVETVGDRVMWVDVTPEENWCIGPELMMECTLVEAPEPEKEEPVVHFTMTEMAVALTLNGKVQVIDFTHPLFKEVRQLVVDGAYLEASEKMDIKTAIEKYSGGRLKIDKGVVKFDGRIISNNLANKMVDLMGLGDEGFKSFAKFFELVMENPSSRTRERLMDFVAAEDIGLNSEGHILAFKNVKDTFRPSRSGVWTNKEDGSWDYNSSSYYDNNVGSVCEMPRTEVDDIESNTCSRGLHVMSLTYAKSFWGVKGKTMKVSVHPADVVAIPPDYNNSKARTCKYTVVEDVTDTLQQYLDKLA